MGIELVILDRDGRVAGSRGDIGEGYRSALNIIVYVIEERFSCSVVYFCRFNNLPVVEGGEVGDGDTACHNNDKAKRKKQQCSRDKSGNLYRMAPVFKPYILKTVEFLSHCQ